MSRWLRNRVLPAALTLGNAVFWLCLRNRAESAARYSFVAATNLVWLRCAAFFLLGSTLAWMLAAFGARGKTLWARSLCGGAGFALFRAAYNLLAPVYAVCLAAELPAVCAGAALVCLLAGGAAAAGEAPDARASLEPISAGRDLLMGLAMLYVLLFHTEISGADYPPVLREFVRFGFAGVDLFLLVSGLGMVRALERTPRLGAFYARRARRIYPQAVPWVAAYSLVCMAAGRCGIALLIANCLGVGYWVSGGAGAFNWYLSAILLFYLLAPLLYRLLKRRETRGRRAALVLALSLLPMFAAVDLLGRWRLLMALSRLPVFVAGMLLGFALEEGSGPRRSELRWLVPLALPFALGSLTSIAEDFPVLGWLWLCSGAAMALLILPLANLLGRLRKDGLPARALAWLGKNSLPVYLCNALLVRGYGLVVDVRAGSSARRLICALAVAAASALIVRLLEPLSTKLRAALRK